MAMYYLSVSLLFLSGRVQAAAPATPSPLLTRFPNSTSTTAERITSHSESTVTSPASAIQTASITGCPISCSILQRSAIGYNSRWQQRSIGRTVTPATVFAFVDQFNRTSYSTEYNRSVLTPTNTNSAGTVTFAVTAYDYKLGRKIFTTVDYPNALVDYESTLEWQGILPTVYPFNGSRSCLIRTAGPATDTFLSHPCLPIQADTADPEDPRGWTYSVRTSKIDLNFDSIVRLFPDFAPIQKCTPGSPGVPSFSGSRVPTFALPVQAFYGATFVTITSTSRVIAPPISEPASSATPSSSVGLPQILSTAAGQPPELPNDGPSEPYPPIGPDLPEITSGSPALAPSPIPNDPVLGPNRISPLQNSNAVPGDPVPGANNPIASTVPQNTRATEVPIEGALPAPIIVGSTAIIPTEQRALIGDGITLSAGGAATSVAGKQVSVADNGNAVVIDGSTQAVPSSGSVAPIRIGGQDFTPGPPSPVFVIGSQTIQPGGAIVTVDGQRVSVASRASFAFIGDSTQNLGPAATTPTPTTAPQLTVDGIVPPANGEGNYILAGQTIGPGAPAVTISGTAVSIASHGNLAVIGGSTQFLASTVRLAQLTLGSSTYTANAQGNFVIDGQTISPGGTPITISGSIVSIAPGGTAAVVNGVMQSLPLTSNSPAPTIGSQIYSTNANGEIVIAGQTLTPGSAITVSGTEISLAPGGAFAVIGGSTQALPGGAAITAGTATFTPVPGGGYVYEGTTLIPGGPPIIVSGTTVSLGPEGDYALINGQTRTLGIAESGLASVAARTSESDGKAVYAATTTNLDVGEGASASETGQKAAYTGHASKPDLGNMIWLAVVIEVLFHW